MKSVIAIIMLLTITLPVLKAQESDINGTPTSAKEDDWKWKTEQFADVAILRYKIDGWDKLNLNQKTLVYYLSEAGMSGRDIIWDQNYRYNLAIRHALEHIYTNFNGDKNSDNWKAFEVYIKRVWFSNGIHHHYSNSKHVPGFSQEYFEQLMALTKTPLSQEVINAIFDPAIDNKK